MSSEVSRTGARAVRESSPRRLLNPQGRRTLVIRVAVGLIVVQLLVRGLTSLRGWFYLDDFAFMSRATDLNLFEPAFLLHTYNNHVMPGAWVWVWLTTRLFPMEWLPVAVAMLLVQLVLAVVVLRLLVDLFGPTPLILPPFAIALLSPISLPASLWWAAALNQLPQQLAMATGLLALVKYMRTGGRRAALAGPLALAFGLLFSEKSLLLLPLAVAVTVAFFTSGGLMHRVKRTLRRDLLMWVGYGLVALPYAAIYLLVVPTPIRRGDVPGHDVLALIMSSVFRATSPGLVGGPLEWMPIGFAGGLAAPNALVVVFSLAVVAAVVTLTIALRREAVWAWLILALYAGVSIAILAKSRAVLVGPVVATEYRYQTDVALVAAIMLAFASTVMVGSFRRGEPTRSVARPNIAAAVNMRILVPLREVGVMPHDASALVSGLGVGMIVMLSALSTHAYDPYWVNNPAKPWAHTVRSELNGLPPDTRLADTFVPQEVAWGLLYPYNEAYRTLSPVLNEDRVLGDGQSAARVVVPDTAGHLRLALPGGGKAGVGPVRGCGWSISTRSLTVPVPTTVPNPTTLVRIGLVSTSATTLVVGVNGRDTSVRLVPGLNTAILQAREPVRRIVLHSTGGAARVCTNDISVGPAVAIPGTAP